MAPGRVGSRHPSWGGAIAIHPARGGDEPLLAPTPWRHVDPAAAPEDRCPAWSSDQVPEEHVAPGVAGRALAGGCARVASSVRRGWRPALGRPDAYVER